MRKVQERPPPAACMHENAERVVNPGLVICAVSALLALLFHCTNFSSNPSGVLTGSLQGCVVNALNNRPLPDAEILLVGDSAMSVTDTNGVFRLPDIPSGAQMLIVKKMHFASHEAAVLVQTNALSRTDTIRLFADYAMLAGVVRDTVTDSPVQSANVLLRAVSDTAARYSAMTGSNGCFTFDTVYGIDGECRVTIEKQGYAHRTVLQKMNGGDSVFITVYLRPLEKKTFFVYDADTKALLSQAFVRYSGGMAQSDAQGRVEVNAATVPDSGCFFQVWATDYDTLSFLDTIVTGEVIIDSLPLQRQRGCLNGTVRCQGKLNHAGTVVQLSDIASDTTDSLGSFFFADVRAGTYPVIVSKPDFVAWADTVGISGNDTTIDSAVLVITAGTIEDTVVWDAEGSPYRIDGILLVGDGGVLMAGAGAVIRMANGARLSTNGNGVIGTAGSGWNLVRISAGGKGGAGAHMEIRGDLGCMTMKYTLVENVAVMLRDGPAFEHCLFAYTEDFSSDTTVYVDAGDYGTAFSHCDFIRIGTDAPGVFVRDSLYTGDEEGGEVTFSNCIFAQYAGAATGSPFVTSDNSGNIIVRVENCDAYTDGDGDAPPFDIVHIDTSAVWRMEPGYSDAGRGDYSLKKESAFLDKSTTRDFLGALGPAQPHLAEGEP